MATLSGIALKVGKYFKDSNGDTWCCYANNPSAPEGERYSCIRLRDDRVSHFYLDGRAEATGTVKHTITTAL
jgi:hypothetical protein